MYSIVGGRVSFWKKEGDVCRGDTKKNLRKFWGEGGVLLKLIFQKTLKK
jgi:hypothetical protein